MHIFPSPFGHARTRGSILAFSFLTATLTQVWAITPSDQEAAINQDNISVSPTIQVTSSSDGAVVRAAGSNSRDRLSAHSGQAFIVNLQYPSDMAGGEIALDPLDGGKIDGRAYRKSKIGADGLLSFVFTVGQNLGSYQVELRSTRGISNLSFAVEAVPVQ